MSESSAIMAQAVLSRLGRRPAPDAPRLKVPVVSAVLDGPLGDLVLRPWSDWLILRALTRSFFPVSRAWASAAHPEATLETLKAELPNLGLSDRRLGRILGEIAELRQAHEAAESAWYEGFFGGTAPADPARLEKLRTDAAHAFNSSRQRFHGVRRRLPAVRREVATPQETIERLGCPLAYSTAERARQPLPPVQVSHPLDEKQERTRWLSFASRHMGDRAFARVREPLGAQNPPTLILLHGIGVEREMWRQGPIGTGALIQSGVRVVLPEAPWHGRRRLPGWYGGEPVLGRGVAGLVELISAWADEMESLASWARESGSRRVVVAGVSLGSLTAQLAAIEAAGWTPGARLDGLALVAGSGDLTRTLRQSALLNELGVGNSLSEAGWSNGDLATWAERVLPDRAPAVPAEKIVTLLGRPDRVISFRDGLKIARRFKVPRENVLVRPRGHFTLSMAMEHDRELNERLLKLLFERS